MLFEVQGEADVRVFGVVGGGEEVEVAVVLGGVVQDAFVVPVAVEVFGVRAGGGRFVVLLGW